jgi:hypothetical protein
LARMPVTPWLDGAARPRAVLLSHGVREVYALQHLLPSAILHAIRRVHGRMTAYADAAGPHVRMVVGA